MVLGVHYTRDNIVLFLLSLTQYIMVLGVHYTKDNIVLFLLSLTQYMVLGVHYTKDNMVLFLPSLTQYDAGRTLYEGRPTTGSYVTGMSDSMLC